MTYSAPLRSPEPPPLLADHPALDLLNTVVQIGGVPIDFLQSDTDVLHWLRRMGFVVANEVLAFRQDSLRDAARELREMVRALIEQRRAGKLMDVAALNAFLACGSHALVLIEDSNALRVARKFETHTAEQCLLPLAEAAAQLLVENDFKHVRRCEHPECTLYFYDRTKSHRRRWCSMTACGNRYKVARFREKQKK
jgi:predicted RNA-binding Zn ribbon-like protein